MPPVYGVKRPLRSWNPILINFSHLFLLFKDAWRTKSIIDKFRIWFMPTGWRPKDVNQKYPIESIDSPQDYEKYYPKLSMNLQIWSWIQYFITFCFMMYFINNLHFLSLLEGFVFASFLFISIYSLTSLMDKNSLAWIYELFRSVIGILCIFIFGEWFYSSTYFSVISNSLIIYFIFSSLISIYFLRTERN